PGQSFIDGAYDFHWVCGGRRDCRDGKHFAPPGTGNDAVCRCPEGFARDWIDYLHYQHVADRGLYSYFADGRNCGPPVSRIRSDAFHCNYHLDGDFADHHPHDVRLHFEGTQKGAAWFLVSDQRKIL